MAQGKLLNIPFAMGIDERTAPRELEPRALREAVNVRQRRLKAFGMRADYPAESMTEFDGTWVPYDLYPLNGRLISLGDRQSRGYPTDLAELVAQPGGNWKGTLPVGSTGVRVPPGTAVRNIGTTPDATAQVQAVRVAALNGIVCMVYGFGGTTGGTTSHVHIFRADTDATICQQAIPAANAQVVVAGDSFWILGVSSGDDVVGYRFDTTVDDDLQAVVSLLVGTVTNSIFHAVEIFGIGGREDFIFIARTGATTAIRVINEAGVQESGWAGPAVAADILQIEADDGIAEVVVLTRVGSADVFASRYHLPATVIDPATLLNGPTALFGEAVTGDLSISRSAASANEIHVCTEDASATVKRWRGPTTTFSGVVTTMHNYTMGGTSVRGQANLAAPIGVLQPMISGDSSNQLLLLDAVSFSSFYVLAQVDDQIANPLIGAVGKGGQVARDTVSGRLYWARILEGTDGGAIAGVSEVRIGSTDRRQACQVGNAMLVSGGEPLSFDGRQVVECGFLERPVFVSTTPSNTGGDLISGAEYDFVAIYQWIDGQNRSIKSRLSDIQTVTMGAADNGVTAIIFAPHTLRKDANTGSTPVISLYRTDATELTTAASITGTNVATVSLAGQTLRLFVTDSLGVDTSFVVTFGAGTGTDSYVADINAVTTGRLTATNTAGLVTLTVDEEGVGTQVRISDIFTIGGAVLGFTPGTTSDGESTFVKGSVFHLATSAIVPVTAEFGAPVTLVDNTSDEDLLEAETLYTMGEQGALTGILERESPPPCRYAWTVGARAFIGGLPDPSEVAISFELAAAETLAFSAHPSFRAVVDGDVTAVASLDGVPIVFTADSIYRFGGQLPNDQGADGELGTPFRIPSEGGCSNANSLLETSMGLFYQARDGKMMILPRGGAAPVWIGQLVQDTLEAFPTVIAAAYADSDHCALFCCVAASGTSSVILVYDLRIGQWYRDEFTGSAAIKAATDFRGRLAYVDFSLVRLQSASLTPATFIPYNATTGSLAPYQGSKAGHGSLICITVNGEFRGNATLQCRISYDDGQTFTTLATKTFSTVSLAVGDSFVVQWYPRIRKGNSYVLDFVVTALAGAATPGLILNTYTVEAAEAQPIKRQRTTGAQRG